MNKRYWHHIWTAYVRPIKIWYLLALFLVAALVCAFALRGNNVRMIQLRSNVYTADQNNTDVAKSLQDLQRYVTSHMNTSLTAGTSVYPPVQLKYTYQRLQQAAQANASAANSETYNAAQKYCESQNSADYSGHNRVPCIEQYVSDHGAVKAKVVPDGLYKFDFASPYWSSDLAGWTLLITLVLFVLLAVRIIVGIVIKHIIS